MSIHYLCIYYQSLFWHCVSGYIDGMMALTKSISMRLRLDKCYSLNWLGNSLNPYNAKLKKWEDLH